MTGKLVDLTIGLDGKQRVTIQLNEDFRQRYDDLRDQTLAVEIKKYRPRRSLDANAYAWVLIDKLASRLRLPKVEVYRDLIKSIPGVSQTVCIKTDAVDALVSGWGHNGLGWTCDTYPSKIKGCTNVILYYGSSTYDSKQMSDLIDLLVEDCIAQGIETATPDELAKYKDEWKK